MAQRHRAGFRERAEESDEQLCERVRRGDQHAFGELYRRHHKAAESTARCFVRSRSDADDVVSDAFAGVLSAMRNGYGPRDNFRRYLLACVRNGCRVRPRNVPFAPEDTRLDSRAPGDGPILEDPERYVEADTVARAFSALSPRWQQMLWSTAVEQKSPQELGEQLSLSPNAAAALAHRAREAFATAYLGEHLATRSSPECRRYAPHLAGFVRNQLPPGRAVEVGDHVEACLMCSAAVADLRDVNASLRTLVPVPGALAPAAVEAGAGSSLPAAVSGGATLGASMTGLAVKGLVGALLLAPLLITRVTGFDGGIAEGLRRPVVPVDSVVGGPTTLPVADPTTDPTVAPALTPAVTDLAAVTAVTDLTDLTDLADLTDVGERTPSGSAVSEAPGGVTPAAPGTDDGGTGVGGVVTTSPVLPTSTEGLLGTLGVDDALEPVGLDVVSDTVDAIVYALTADVVAPVLANAVESLGLPLDLGELPPVPGVVLAPTTLSPAEQAVPASTAAPSTNPPATDPTTAAPATSAPPAPVVTRPAVTAPPTTLAAATPPAVAPTTSAPTSAPTTSPGLVCTVLDLLGLCANG